MDVILDTQKARRETLRWHVLHCLYSTQEVGANEVMIKNVVEPLWPDVTTMEIRRTLDYLTDRGLVDMLDQAGPVWRARINHHGIDVVEYTVECHAGIARPKRW